MNEATKHAYALIVRMIESIMSSVGVDGCALPYGSFTDRNLAIAHGGKPASAKSKNGHRAERIFFAKTGTPLFGNAEYEVSKFVVTAIIGSKAHGRAGALDEMADLADPRVETREEVATLTATITDAPDAPVNSGESVAILANAAAGIYRYHTSKGLSLDARIVGTKLSVRELGSLARAIGVHV
jgi:hypothetical protein